MVGGFVEQQHVGLLKQQAAQGHPALFAAREVADDGIAIGGAQRVHGPLQLRVEVPGIELIEALLHGTLALEQLVEVGVFAAKGFVDFLELLEQGYRFGHALLHHFEHRFAGIELGFLLEVAHRIARRPHYVALNLLVEAGNNFEQTRLTRAIEAEHADFGTVEKREVDIFKNLFLGRVHLRYPGHREDNSRLVAHERKN